jgi:hypothetical protein
VLRLPRNSSTACGNVNHGAEPRTPFRPGRLMINAASHDRD